MRFWFTADTHFNHANIIKYCNRPFFSAEHMDMEIISRWNNKVGQKDVVIHAGDFAFLDKEKDFQYYEDQLNGKIVIIRGNHDSRESSSIIYTAMIRIGGKELYVAHEPGTLRPINLCGHVHDNWKVIKIKNVFIVNIGVDVWNFEPIDINDILNAVKEYRGYFGDPKAPMSNAPRNSRKINRPNDLR